MQELLRQAQKLQEDMEAAQKRLREEEMTASSPNAEITFKITGSTDFNDCIVAPSLYTGKSDKEIAELILSAVQEAVSLAKKKHEAEMKVITSTLNLPGM